MILTYTVNLKDSRIVTQKFHRYPSSDWTTLEHLLLWVDLYGPIFVKNVYTDGVEKTIKTCMVLNISPASGSILCEML